MGTITVGARLIPTNMGYYRDLIYMENIRAMILDSEMQKNAVILFDYLPRDVQISLLARKIAEVMERKGDKNGLPYSTTIDKLESVYFISKFTGEVNKIKMPQDLNRFAYFRSKEDAEYAIKILEDNGYKVKPNNN